MNHQLVWQQSPKEFREDVESSVKLLQDITGQLVECFRAPGFSIREQDAWAFDILADIGIKYDCSVFPANHAHGGMPNYGSVVPSIVKHGGVEMREFPVCIKNLVGKHLIFSGGGYFRLLPYSLIKSWSKECDKYLLSYIHPRDLDDGQPMLEGLPFRRKFRSYVGIKTAEKKIRKYLCDFQFTDLKTASDMIDWNKVPVVELK